jgi:hypothetical protein
MKARKLKLHENYGAKYSKIANDKKFLIEKNEIFIEKNVELKKIYKLLQALIYLFLLLFLYYFFFQFNIIYVMRVKLGVECKKLSKNRKFIILFYYYFSILNRERNFLLIFHKFPNPKKYIIFSISLTLLQQKDILTYITNGFELHKSKSSNDEHS